MWKYHVHFGERIGGAEFLAEEVESLGCEIERKLAIFFHPRRSIDTNRNTGSSLRLNVTKITNNECK
jgi:hypothetical protein